MIKHFLECYIPMSNCNFECEYCYVRQWGKNNSFSQIKLQYSDEIIQKAFAQERWSGQILISLCAIGETTLSTDLFRLVSILLSLGHIVSITSNGTVTKELIKYCNLPEEHRERLHFNLSFHYLELIKKNLLETFTNNFHMLRNSNISVTIKFNYADCYYPYINEIKEYCLSNFGGIPAVAPVRDESDHSSIHYLTNRKNYLEEGKLFGSKEWDFMIKYLNKRIKKFCYAGVWSHALNIYTGELSSCYCAHYNYYNIYKKPEEKIPEKPVGKNCKSAFCANADFFIGFGCVPTIKTPTFKELRNSSNANWYSKQIEEALSTKFYKVNKKLPASVKAKLNAKTLLLKCKRIAKKILRK